jgi:acyl-CoA oxidase
MVANVEGQSEGGVSTNCWINHFQQMTMSAFAASWSSAISSIRDEPTYQASASKLRSLIQSKLLLYTDLENDPDKFFLAHSMLVDPKKRGPGFCIRFTVQFNLFAGTVIGLGNAEQIRSLADMQTRGDLGCFALTEKYAGVNSGLVVNTIAEYMPSTKQFVITSPNQGAHKKYVFSRRLPALTHPKLDLARPHGRQGGGDCRLAH